MSYINSELPTCVIPHMFSWYKYPCSLLPSCVTALSPACSNKPEFYKHYSFVPTILINCIMPNLAHFSASRKATEHFLLARSLLGQYA